MLQQTIPPGMQEAPGYEPLDTEAPGPSKSNEGLTENGENDLNVDTDITEEEEDLLDKAGAGEPGDDESKLANAQLDDTDEDGDKLNESIDHSGEDLDVPGSEADDYDESIGEEDEQNNSYSIRDQDTNDDIGLKKE